MIVNLNQELYGFNRGEYQASNSINKTLGKKIRSLWKNGRLVLTN